MITKSMAINSFWSAFGLPAYDMYSVPTGENAPAFPYITYDLREDSFDHPVSMTASLWYRSTSWTAAEAKAKEISEAIGSTGTYVMFDHGAVIIQRGSPFAQRMSDPDDTVRRIYINITAEYISVD